jgi:adenylate cyclase
VIDCVAIVSALSKQQVADQAGVDLGYVGRLVERGVLVPDEDGTFTRGDARRARLYRGLERAGIPLDAMVEAVKRHEVSFAFLDRPLYDRFSRLSTRSFRQVSADEGIPLELVMVVREAIGFAQPDPDDRIREDELGVVPIIRLQLSRGFDPSVIERWLRVYADSLRRVTETETDWWRTEIAEPSRASGLSEAEMLEATNEWGEEFASLTEQAFLAIYHANQEHAWTAGLIEEVEDALERAGLRTRVTTLPAICFLDVTGYTRLTEERGDEAAAALIEQLTPLVTRASDRHGGKVVKLLGDGVMFHFREPEGAVLAAFEMLEAISHANLPPAHVGVHAGPVVFQGGDYFGRTVNLAARIAERAGPGQVLVTDEVAKAVDLGHVTFDEIGPVVLKGVSKPVRLHSAHRRVRAS